MTEARRRGGFTNSKPQSEAQRIAVLPYIKRRATSLMVSMYTGLSIKEVNRATAWSRLSGKLPDQTPESTANLRAMVVYERQHFQTGVPKDVQDMVTIGKQLVDKKVLTEDTTTWEMMLGQYKAQDRVLKLPDLFPGRLLLEGFLVSQLENRVKLATALRTILSRAGLMERFESEFDFLSGF